MLQDLEMEINIACITKQIFRVLHLMVDGGLYQTISLSTRLLAQKNAGEVVASTSFK